jgi:multiple sugar transport system permease protein
MGVVESELRPPVRRPTAPVRRRRMLGLAMRHTTLLFLAIVFLAPLVFILLTAVMTDNQVLSSHLWPSPFRWSNFADVFRRIPFARFTWNTLQIAALTTVGTLVSCIPVAYALSHLRWRGRGAALLVILATYMLPIQATIIPMYVLFAKLHWIGSFKPLIVPSFFGDAFAIFLLRQFFLTVPTSLADAARIEGASEFSVMTRVVVPLAKPAIAAVALFNFLYAWNDYFLPLLYIGEKRELWTLSLGLADFRTLHQVQWNLTLAASLMFMVPAIAVFIAAQRVVVRGVALRPGPER